MFGRSSGLDIGQAISSLSKSTFAIFEAHFLEIASKGGSAITTHTAAEIASNLTVGLISPITKQIDPLRVGEFERKINISLEYGIRLNANTDLVKHLVRSYPDHAFVIDFEEASELFGNVRILTELEYELHDCLLLTEERSGYLYISHPNDNGIVGFLGKQQENTANEGGNESANARPNGEQPLNEYPGRDADAPIIPDVANDEVAAEQDGGALESPLQKKTLRLSVTADDSIHITEFK